MTLEVPHDHKETKRHGLSMEASRVLIVRFGALRDHRQAGDSAGLR